MRGAALPLRARRLTGRDFSVSCTLKDVATEAGVSVTTVVRVVHSQGKVSSATRARVQAAIAKMRYAPNLHASKLTQIREDLRNRRPPNAPLSARLNPDSPNKATIDARMRSLEQENRRLKQVISKLRSVLDVPGTASPAA